MPFVTSKVSGPGAAESASGVQARGPRWRPKFESHLGRGDVYSLEIGCNPRGVGLDRGGGLQGWGLRHPKT